MKREDIKGFTIKILGYSIEVVTVKYITCTIAIYKRSVGKNTRDFSHGMNCQYMIVI